MLHVQPQHWEADVILNDGSIATIRAIDNGDKEAIYQFYDRVSDKSKFLRFFGTHPTLSDSDMQRWLDIEGYERVTLVLEERGDIVAVAGYAIVQQFLPARVGDVSFLVQDSHQGKGVGPIMLEHLAQIGREGNVSRFFAEMLMQNRTMTQVFISAGYQVKPELEDGMITVDFEISPNKVSREVMERRETRAEANSLRRLLTPQRVAVVGVHDRVASHVTDFAGEVIAFDDIAALSAVAEPIDLVVAVHDPHELNSLMQCAADVGAHGVVLTTPSDYPPLNSNETRDVVMAARDVGLRVLGPTSLGLINTDPEVRLNTTPVPVPRSGSVGLFTQSSGVAMVMLSHAVSRGTGLSVFLASGSFADVTGNDVMQFWSDDERTHICMLSLDSGGNPRKFFRIVRRLALEKYVIVFLPSRALRSAIPGNETGLAPASSETIDAVIRQSGAMVVNRRDAMFDIAQILARQPLPRGRRVAVVSNSSGLALQMAASAQRFGLRPVVKRPVGTGVQGMISQVELLLDDANVDIIVCAVVEIDEPAAEESYAHLAALAAKGKPRPLIASFIGIGLPNYGVGLGEEQQGQLPVFDNYADAMEALGVILDNQRRRAAIRPSPDDLVGSGDEDVARGVVDKLLAQNPEGRWASDTETAEILAAYGIDLVPWTDTPTFAEALQASEKYGWDVVLKATSPLVRGRSELPTVIRQINTEDELAHAWKTLEKLAEELHLGSDAGVLQPAVQRQVASGASLKIRAVEDPVLGPLVGVGVSGISSELLKDVAWRIPPLRRHDVVDMLSDLKAAPLLTGQTGMKPIDIRGLESVLLQLSKLKDDIAAVVEAELIPVIVGIDAVHVVGARLRVAPLGQEREPLARALQ